MQFQNQLEVKIKSKSYQGKKLIATSTTATTRSLLALFDDLEEQVLHGRRWVVHPIDFTPRLFDDVSYLTLGIVRQTTGMDLGQILDLQQAVDSAKLLEFSLVKDRHTIANILNVC